MLATSSRIVIHPFVQKFTKFDSVSEKGTRNVNTFRSDNDYSLTLEKLFWYIWG